MRLTQLNESNQVIIRVGSGDANTTGTPKRGQIKPPGHVLTEIFGEPQHLNDVEVNFMWELEFAHRDKDADNEDDQDYIKLKGGYI